MFNTVIHTEPVAKGRPRVAFRGKHPVIYTDQKTKNFEKLVQEHCLNEMDSLIMKSLYGPLKVELSFQFQIPRSRKTFTHDCKPDLDNLAKSVLDGMNGIVFKDDGQIVELTLRKEFGFGNKIDISVQKYLN